jgi:hypothetical protein
MKFCSSDSEKNKQQDSFAWNDDLCKYEGFFDPTKVKKQEIQNALSLISRNPEDLENYGPAVYELKDLKRISSNGFKKLKEVYQNQIKRLSEIELPKKKVWETMRREKLRETEQLYKKYKIVYEAYLTDNMQVLKEFDKKDKLLNLYADALINGGADLLSAWEHFIELQISKHGSPESRRTIYHEQLNSENKFKHAKIDLLTFGWGNCANEYIDHFGGSRGEKWSKHNEEYRKLFTSIKEIECDMP